MSNPLSIDEILGLASTTPSFLEKTKASYYPKEAPPSKKQGKIIASNAEIHKEAVIDKQRIQALKDFEQNYTKLRDLNELARISEGNNNYSNNNSEDIAQNKNKEKIQKNIPDYNINMNVSFKGHPGQEDNQSNNNKNNKYANNNKIKHIRKGRPGRNREKQTIKEKEKEKRMKGQSSIGSWKSETFMQLRQQFD